MILAQIPLHIKDNGPNARGFYIKDREGQQTEYVDSFADERRHKRKGNGVSSNMPLVTTRRRYYTWLIWDVLILTPWSSTTDHADMPDFISIDLDPSDDDFHKVIDIAREAKDVFDLLEAKKRHQDIWKDGYALFIPSSGFDYAQARAIAEHLCGITSEQVPDISTTEVTITNRGNKLFVDPSQNDYADTLIFSTAISYTGCINPTGLERS